MYCMIEIMIRNKEQVANNSNKTQKAYTLYFHMFYNIFLNLLLIMEIYFAIDFKVIPQILLMPYNRKMQV